MRATLAALLAALMMTPISSATSGSRVGAYSSSFDPADFAPIVYLHRNDHLRPASAASSLSKAKLWWHHHRCRDDHLSSFKGSNLDIERLGAGGFTHRASRGFFKRCRLDQRVFRSNELTRPLERSSPVPRREGFYLAFPGGSFKYGEPNRSKTPRIYEGAPVYAAAGPNHVAYWFFYPYSSPVKAWQMGKRRDAAHEGDWENVTVHVVDGIPQHIAYFAHGDPVICDWRDAPRERGHPVVYSAWGSHASYPTAGLHPPVDFAEAGLRWDSARDLHPLPAAGDGTRLKQTSEDPEVSWYGYGGGWGRVGKAAAAKPLPGAKETTGPLGPSRYKRGLPRQWIPSPVCK